MYVEALIGRDTVDTIPPATMDAFRDHGEATPDVIEQDVAGARAVLAELEEHGVSLKEVTDAAGQGGGATVRGRVRQAVRHHRAPPPHAARGRARLPGDRAGLAGDEDRLRGGDGGLAQRTDASGGSGPGTSRCGPGRTRTNGSAGCTSSSKNWLILTGCVTSRTEVKQRGFTDVVLLGMGGSSLGPEVLGETFGRQSGWPRFHMLDSTDPAQIKAIERAIDLGKTLFIVSSKSGSTLEPNIFMDYFLDRVGAVRGKDKAGEHFVAVTDPGSPLERRAQQLRFAHIFDGVPSIGGRYSVLSKFGLVPAAAMGLDVKRLLETTQTMERSCGRRRAAGGESGRAARRRHGRRGNPLRTRQGDDHRLAGNRRFRRVAGAASGGEHGQAGTRADPAGR